MRMVVGLPIVLIPGSVTYLISALPGAAGVVGTAVGAVLGIAASYLAYHLVVVRVVEGRRRPSELDLHGAVRELAAGLLAGIALLGSAIAGIALIGGATFSWGSPGAETLQAGIAVAVVPAFVEELAFRGLLFRVTEESLGTWGALAVSSLLFGFGHALNDGATPWSCLAIALEAGLLLAAVYLITRRLWACVGLHLGWNLAQVLLGLTVSGNRQRVGLCSVRLLGSQAVTGGGFGPEASVVTVALLTSVGVGLLWYAHRTGRFASTPGRRFGSGIGPASTGPGSAGPGGAGPGGAGPGGAGPGGAGPGGAGRGGAGRGGAGPSALR